MSRRRREERAKRTPKHIHRDAAGHPVPWEPTPFVPQGFVKDWLLPMAVGAIIGAFIWLLMALSGADDAYAQAGRGTSSFSAPKPSFSAPARPSPSTFSGSKPASYNPPAKAYAPPPVNRWPAGAPVAAFHDTHSALYWANPASPYYALYVAQYGQPGGDDEVPAWSLWALGGLMAAFVLGMAGWLTYETRS